MFKTGQKEKKESEPLDKIQLKHLIIAFLILGVGCLIALIVFMIEIFCGKKVQEGQQGSNSENKNIDVSHTSDWELHILSDHHNKTQLFDADSIKDNEYAQYKDVNVNRLTDHCQKKKDKESE